MPSDYGTVETTTIVHWSLEQIVAKRYHRNMTMINDEVSAAASGGSNPSPDTGPSAGQALTSAPTGPVSRTTDTAAGPNPTTRNLDDSYGAVAGLLRSLADPTRLRLLAHLSLGEHQVGELVDRIGLAQSTVSVHLTRLKSSGIITKRIEGRSSYYAIRDPKAVMRILAMARTLLAHQPAAAAAEPMTSQES